MADPIAFPGEIDSNTARAVIATREPVALRTYTPSLAVLRKSAGRDRYERDLSLLTRVRESYRRQAERPDWVLINGEASKDEVRAAVDAAILPKLAEA